MATTAWHQQPTPERFFNAINAYQQTEAMRAAVELEVFTAIAEGNATAATIAKRCRAAERGVRTLCDFLTIHGFVTKEGARYGLAPDSALFLDRNSPAYLGGAIEFLLTTRLREGHARLTEAVRRGGCALGEGTLEPENPDWVKFAQAMMPLMHMPAEIMAAELRKGGEAHKVLDIAAGHGIFGISVAKQNPAAHIYAADWKNVLEVARKNAQAMGVADRYHPIADLEAQQKALFASLDSGRAQVSDGPRFRGRSCARAARRSRSGAWRLVLGLIGKPEAGSW